MSLRSAARSAGLDPQVFEPLLDFVEWTGMIAPSIALERARELRERLEDVLVRANRKWSMHDFQECRYSLESAARFQHSSGDAAARLVFASLVDESLPQEMHLSGVVGTIISRD